MSEESDEDRFRQIVYGVVVVATVTFGAWAGSEIIAINVSLAKVETSISENRHERQIQFEEIRRRLERLEGYKGCKD